MSRSTREAFRVSTASSSEPSTPVMLEHQLVFDTDQLRLDPMLLKPSLNEDRGHILVVEDDLIIADLIDQILRFESFQVTHVADGQSAVAYATSEFPDLILMDLMLPVLSGMDASRIIKSHPDEGVSGIPIVAMSAGVNLRATAYDLAVEGVLAKPFDIDVLLATVDIHIRKGVNADE